MAPAIDLNADLAEGFPWDETLLGLVTSASLACGAHAGDPATARRALSAARKHGVSIGAHPGYPDPARFGRVERSASRADVAAWITTQVDRLRRLAHPENVPIRFVKPHGALYNQAQREPEIAAGVIDALGRLQLPLLGLPGSLLERLAREAGVHYVPEGFLDRRYQADGSLVPRTRPDALLTDPREIEAQILRLATSGQVATLCIHGDTPHGAEFAETARRVLQAAGIALRSFA